MARDCQFWQSLFSDILSKRLTSSSIQKCNEGTILISDLLSNGMVSLGTDRYKIWNNVWEAVIMYVEFVALILNI